MSHSILQKQKNQLLRLPYTLIHLSRRKKLLLYSTSLVTTVLLIAIHLWFTELISFLGFSLVPIVLSAILFGSRTVWATTLFLLILNGISLRLYYPEIPNAEILTPLFFFTLYLVIGLLINKLVHYYNKLHMELNIKHETEALLEEEKNWFRVTLLSIGDGIITTDAEKKIIFMNHQAEGITGWSLEETRGMDVTQVYKIYNENTHQLVSDPIGRIRERGVVIGLANHTLLEKKNGTEIPISDTGAPIKDKSGIVLGFVLTFRDVSSKQDLKQKLQTARIQTIQAEKMAGIGQLAAGVAHEINNPLGYISSNQEIIAQYLMPLTQLLQRYRNKYSDEELTRLAEKWKIDYILQDLDPLLEDNMAGVSQISDIIHNLQDFSRSDSHASPAILDLNRIIKNILVLVQNEIKPIAKVVLHLENTILINGNTSEINQVILNLVLNAAYGIKEKFKSRQGLIEISSTITENKAVCCISDNGCGIPDENLPRIFEPFFTTREPGQGPGLGLYIAFNTVVQRHNGEISVQSEKDKGTRLTIKFPLAKEKKAGKDE